MGFFDDIPQQKNHKRATCVSCGLYQSAKTPRIEMYGKFKKQIMIIADQVMEEDDIKGKHFQSKNIHLLNGYLRKFDIDLFQDCLITTAVQCFTKLDSFDNLILPTSQQITCCRSRVLNQIKESKPKLIFLLGSAAVESVIGFRWQNSLWNINKWRGWTIPDRDFNAWLCPIFSYTDIEKDRRELRIIWEQDIENALSKLENAFPVYESEHSQIEIIEDLSILMQLEAPIAFDYETTGLKPQQQGHEIICGSASGSNNKSYAFMMPEKGTKNYKRLIKFLTSDISKCGQNIKFEDTWTKEIIGVNVNNWVWDCMLATHILDNRPDICGLKFQSLVQFGIYDYASNVSQYLKAKDNKNANAFNEIKNLISTETGKRNLLIYCGIDSLLERRLCVQQMKEFERLKELKEEEEKDLPPWD